MVTDDTKFKRVLEFMANKRGKDDVLIIFDGRGKANRRVIESVEDKLAPAASHTLVECWCVYVQPAGKDDPRAARRAEGYSSNNKEMAFFSLPAVKGPRKVVHRAEYNSCGESSSAATTYTGIKMRRFSELPRMLYDAKASIVGALACDPQPRSKSRLQEDIDERGHPYSHNEVKPIHFWQSIMEHHKVTHIVDFTPGSGALAVAASGYCSYEGLAANEEHQKWLDAIVDRCVMYKAGHEQGYSEKLGMDAEFVGTASKYFGGTMMEAARRMLMPVDDEDGEDDVGAQAAESSDSE